MACFPYARVQVSCYNLKFTGTSWLKVHGPILLAGFSPCCVVRLFAICKLILGFMVSGLARFRVCQFHKCCFSAHGLQEFSMVCHPLGSCSHDSLEGVRFADSVHRFLACAHGTRA